MPSPSASWSHGWGQPQQNHLDWTWRYAVPKRKLRPSLVKEEQVPGKQEQLMSLNPALAFLTSLLQAFLPRLTSLSSLGPSSSWTFSTVLHGDLISVLFSPKATVTSMQFRDPVVSSRCMVTMPRRIQQARSRCRIPNVSSTCDNSMSCINTYNIHIHICNM